MKEERYETAPAPSVENSPKWSMPISPVVQACEHLGLSKAHDQAVCVLSLNPYYLAAYYQ